MIYDPSLTLYIGVSIWLKCFITRTVQKKGDIYISKNVCFKVHCNLQETVCINSIEFLKRTNGRQRCSANFSPNEAQWLTKL